METADGFAASETGSHWFQLGKNIELGYCYELSIWGCVSMCICRYVCMYHECVCVFLHQVACRGNSILGIYRIFILKKLFNFVMLFNDRFFLMSITIFSVSEMALVSSPTWRLAHCKSCQQEGFQGWRQ